MTAAQILAGTAAVACALGVALMVAGTRRHSQAPGARPRSLPGLRQPRVLRLLMSVLGGVAAAVGAAGAGPQADSASVKIRVTGMNRRSMP